MEARVVISIEQARKDLLKYKQYVIDMAKFRPGQPMMSFKEIAGYEVALGKNDIEIVDNRIL